MPANVVLRLLTEARLEVQPTAAPGYCKAYGVSQVSQVRTVVAIQQAPKDVVYWTETGT